MSRYLPLKLSVLSEHGRRGHVAQIEFVSHNDAHNRGIAEAALVEWRLINNLVPKKGCKTAVIQDRYVCVDVR